MSKKIELIDRFIYERALEKRINEVLEQRSPDNNEPQFSDFIPFNDKTFENPNPRTRPTVVKIGPGLNTANERSEGTYALLVQSDTLEGGRRGWQRKYAASGAGQGADARRARLHRELAVVARDAFLRVLQRPLAWGPLPPSRSTPWRRVLQTSNGRGQYVEQLFLARGNPQAGKNIPDISPGAGTGAQPGHPFPEGYVRFRCYAEDNPTPGAGGVPPHVLEEDHPPGRSAEDLEQLWEGFVELCSENADGGHSVWFVSTGELTDSGYTRWVIEREHSGVQAPREDDEDDDSPGPWSDQIGKVVWGWRPQWHYRIIEVPDNNQIRDVKMRVVDFVWPGKPTRREADNYTFHLRDISDNHRLTQHVRAQLGGDSQYEITDAPDPPSGLNEFRKIVQEMLGGGPKFNVDTSTSWQGWTSESDNREEIEEQNDEDGDPPSNLIGKEVGDDSREAMGGAMGGAARLVPESAIRDAIREVQQMTMNPFAGEERLPPQEVSRPVISGRVSGAKNESQAISMFSSEKNIDSGSYNITCQKAAGDSWTCVANKSDLNSEQGISYPDEEGPGLDMP